MSNDTDYNLDRARQRVIDNPDYADIKAVKMLGNPVDDLIISTFHELPTPTVFTGIASKQNKCVDSTVGIKYDSDKPEMQLLSSIAINELSKVLTFGAKKYAAHNWRKGISSTRLLGAALRHIFAYLGGESIDPETGLSHIAHAMCCCMFILELKVTKPDTDDRYMEVSSSKVSSKVSS